MNRVTLLALALPMLYGVGIAADMHTVSGTVVDGRSDRPMPRVRMVIAPEDNLSAETTQVTGADGRFAFAVPRGAYRLTAVWRGLRETYGQHAQGSGFGSAVITGPDLDTSRLVFRWQEPGAIQGRVTDEWDEPVEDALVQVLRQFVVLGIRQVRVYGWTQTNDIGEYYFGPLPEGTYFVAVTGQPWSAEARIVPGLEERSTEAQSYAPRYFPNAALPGSAQPIVLKAGSEFRADFRMAAVRGSTVTVHVDENAPPESRMNGTLILSTDGVRGSEAQQLAQQAFGNQAVLTGVPPGNYHLRLFSSGPHGVFAQQDVTVGASDVDVTLAPQPWPRVFGKLDVQNARSTPRGTRMVGLIDQDTQATLWARVGADSSFAIASGPVGKARVTLGATDGLLVEKIDVEGAGLQDDMLDIAAGATVQLHIVASDKGGRLRGHAVTGKRPREGVLVVLAPLSPDAKEHEYRGFQTESDASFDLKNVRPGEYLLFATDDSGVEYANRAAIARYLGDAKRVRVEPYADVEQDVAIGAK